jgi:hypothetical protein
LGFKILKINPKHLNYPKNPNSEARYGFVKVTKDAIFSQKITSKSVDLGDFF